VRSLGRSLLYLKPYWRDALGGLVSLFLSSAAGLAIPTLLQRAIDQGITARQLQVTLWTGGLIVVSAAARSVFDFAQGFLAARASQGMA